MEFALPKRCWLVLIPLGAVPVAGCDGAGRGGGGEAAWNDNAATNGGGDDVAATYHVDPGVEGASDDNDGLSPTYEGGTRGPWRTIGHAAASMRAGNATAVAAGTYRETDILFAHSGTADEPIVLSGAGPDQVIIDSGDGEVEANGIIIAPGVSYVTIEGLTIYDVPGCGIVAGSEDDDRSSEGIVVRQVHVDGYGGGDEAAADGIALVNVDEFSVEHVEVEDGGENALSLTGCTDGTVADSTFHDNMAPGSHGVEIHQGHDITVTNCTAYNNRVYGFDVSLWPKMPPFAYDITIEECFAYDNLNSGFSANSQAHDVVFRRNIAWRNGFDPEDLVGGGKWGGFVCYSAAYDVVFEHNVAIGNDGPGFLVSVSDYDETFAGASPPPSNTFTFQNNIAHGNTEEALVLEGTDEWQAISKNNDWSVGPDQEYAVVNMREGFTAAQVNTGEFGTGDISTDPVFADENTTPPDVHLQAGSPCIDAGTDLGGPFEGAAPDVGRHEFEAP